MSAPPRLNLSTNVITTNNISSHAMMSIKTGYCTIATATVYTIFRMDIHNVWTNGFNMLFDKNIGSKKIRQNLYI